MYAYEDDFDDRRPTTRIILCAVAVVVISALLWFVIRPSLGGGGTTSASAFDTVDTVDSTLAAGQWSDPTSTSSAPSTAPSSTAPSSNTGPRVDRTTTTAPDADEPTTTVRAVPLASTVTGDDSTSSVAPALTPEQASYPTLPDGSPTPVLAIFDTDAITLSGTVPSQAAADRLAQLALANSKSPAPLVQFLAINSDVPATVGVRVLEMTSSRFPAGSSDILPEHGKELDRIGAVMNALPNTTVLVIGHADQRGSDEDNFAVSEARARAVVSHLVDFGIDASRLSSRAVGESDLLSLNNDETALELNRRTEFVIYGTLLGT